MFVFVEANPSKVYNTYAAKLTHCPDGVRFTSSTTGFLVVRVPCPVHSSPGSASFSALPDWPETTLLELMAGSSTDEGRIERFVFMAPWFSMKWTTRTTTTTMIIMRTARISMLYYDCDCEEETYRLRPSNTTSTSEHFSRS